MSIVQSFGRAAAFAMTVWSGMAAAQDTTAWKPDPGRGALLAQQLCASCHLVDDKQTSNVTVGVPSFNAIANKPWQTKDRIASVLIKPHTPMPDIQLSTKEIGDIVAYLDQLRRPDSGEPLLKSKKERTKPKYPKQS